MWLPLQSGPGQSPGMATTEPPLPPRTGCTGVRASPEKVRQCSVAKFTKLGGKASLTEIIYSSSKNSNHIHTTVLLLLNH